MPSKNRKKQKTKITRELRLPPAHRRIEETWVWLWRFQIGVSDAGRVWDAKNQKFQKIYTSESGYKTVWLRHGRAKRAKPIGIHHLVVWAFLVEKQNATLVKGMEIHHVDKNPSNNQLSNLQVLTRKQHLAVHNKKSRK